MNYTADCEATLRTFMSKNRPYCVTNALQVHVDPEDKTTYPIQVSGSNYKTNTLFVNESGLYALDKAYSIAFPKSTPINVNKKKRMFEG